MRLGDKIVRLGVKLFLLAYFIYIAPVISIKFQRLNVLQLETHFYPEEPAYIQFHRADFYAVFHKCSVEEMLWSIGIKAHS